MSPRTRSDDHLGQPLLGDHHDRSDYASGDQSQPLSPAPGHLPGPSAVMVRVDTLGLPADDSADSTDDLPISGRSSMGSLASVDMEAGGAAPMGGDPAGSDANSLLDAEKALARGALAGGGGGADTGDGDDDSLGLLPGAGAHGGPGAGPGSRCSTRSKVAIAAATLVLVLALAAGAALIGASNSFQPSGKAGQRPATGHTRPPPRRPGYSGTGPPRRPAANCPRMRPSFIVVGAQKAGTTSLYAYLRTHPQIIGLPNPHGAAGPGGDHLPAITPEDGQVETITMHQQEPGGRPHIRPAVEPHFSLDLDASPDPGQGGLPASPLEAGTVDDEDDGPDGMGELVDPVPDPEPEPHFYVLRLPFGLTAVIPKPSRPTFPFFGGGPGSRRAPGSGSPALAEAAGPGTDEPHAGDRPAAGRLPTWQTSDPMYQAATEAEATGESALTPGSALRTKELRFFDSARHWPRLGGLGHRLHQGLRPPSGESAINPATGQFITEEVGRAIMWDGSPAKPADIHQMTPAQLQEVRQRYEKFFPCQPDEATLLHDAQHGREKTVGYVTGEATPGYMYRPEVPARIRAVLPDVKLIALVRDPAERAYSHYHHAQKNHMYQLARRSRKNSQEKPPKRRFRRDEALAVIDLPAMSDADRQGLPIAEVRAAPPAATRQGDRRPLAPVFPAFETLLAREHAVIVKCQNSVAEELYGQDMASTMGGRAYLEAYDRIYACHQTAILAEAADLQVSPWALQLILRSIYIAQIHNMRKEFPAEQILVVRSEELFDNVDTALDSITDFIGLERRSSFPSTGGQLPDGPAGGDDHTTPEDQADAPAGAEDIAISRGPRSAIVAQAPQTGKWDDWIFRRKLNFVEGNRVVASHSEEPTNRKAMNPDTLAWLDRLFEPFESLLEDYIAGQQH
ncbi:hypothetical protein H696_02235 [Fonticula alba]|uniref:Sulfotransferase domain-containing protein n=1 Tax=Fonticula alba TaxID=691883 RepID=A0A058ZAC6_FONAL|nr:hypothetical protein H696_02235 [Fonticula alba]KCV71289.1 hypothetical protein H696_02235 [Fonticula alba]|eukprot:XP_009494412.1 hypothetical protein H696_02235 [Fonticula alba]